MKKYISIVLIIALIFSMTTFAFASGDTITWSSKSSSATHEITFKTLKQYHYDSSIRYYVFETNCMSVRVDKNAFFAHDLSSITVSMDRWKFGVTFNYTSGQKTAMKELVIESEYTITSSGITPTSMATFGKTRITNDSTAKNTIVFSTKKVGKFTVSNFEFSDVADKSLWYYDYVNKCASLGLISGMGDGTFMPQNSITRAQLAVLIVKATEHIIDYRVDSKLSFSDVPKNAWYYEYVMKCASMGIIFGMGDNTFMPDRNATRQEIAALTARVINTAKYFNGQRVPTITSTQSLSKLYKDSKSIANWAKKDVLLCNKLSIMVGDDRGFRPLANTTRAECARIFYDLKNSLI